VSLRARSAGITLLAMGSSAMRAVSFRLPGDLDDKLSDVARRRGMSRSAVLRAAIEAMDAHAEQESVTRAGARLVGSVSGPRDLATSPKRMRGYGRSGA
jgi:hypothetical protein